MKKEYKQFGKMSFDVRTPDEVCKILEHLNKTRERVRIRCGDTETGQDYNDEYDTIGTIGRSTGTYKIPLMISKTNAMGGPALLDHCVLKITSAKTGRVLYKHPKYQERKLEIVPSDMPEFLYNTTIDGVLHGRHKSMQSAKLTINKLS